MIYDFEASYKYKEQYKQRKPRHLHIQTYIQSSKSNTTFLNLSMEKAYYFS